MQNQKVKRNLLIHVFVYLTYTYILNARFGTERIYTYIVLIHHVGMGPLTSHSTKLCKSIMVVSQRHDNQAIVEFTTTKYEKASGCSFGNRKQQPLFACSFMARAAIKIRV